MRPVRPGSEANSLRREELTVDYSASPPRHELGHLHCRAGPRDPLLRSERTQGFAAGPVYGRARCSPMLGCLKT